MMSKMTFMCPVGNGKGYCGGNGNGSGDGLSTISTKTRRK